MLTQGLSYHPGNTRPNLNCNFKTKRQACPGKACWCSLSQHPWKHQHSPTHYPWSKTWHWHMISALSVWCPRTTSLHPVSPNIGDNRNAVRVNWAGSSASARASECLPATRNEKQSNRYHCSHREIPQRRCTNAQTHTQKAGALSSNSHKNPFGAKQESKDNYLGRKQTLMPPYMKQTHMTPWQGFEFVWDHSQVGMSPT